MQQPANAHPLAPANLLRNFRRISGVLAACLMLAMLAAFQPALGQMAFAPPVSYPALDGPPINVGLPSSVKLADLDGDKNLDLIVGFALPGATNIQVRYGLGDGTFGPPTYLRTLDDPRAVFAGDGNNDQRIDLLVANPASDGFSYLINSGIGFAPFQAYLTPAGYNPLAIEVADFNSDGTNDLVVVNAAHNSISIYLGRADEIFVLNGNLATGPTPVSVVVDDFNKDGRLDIVVGNSGNNTLSVFFGYQDGTFATPMTVTAGGGTGLLELGVADFNADGYPDLLAVKYVSDMIVGLRNNQFGNFIPALTNTVTTPRGLVVADLNQDKIPDLAVGISGGSDLRIFRGLTNGYTLVGDFPCNTEPVALAAGNLNGDEAPDLVAANYTPGTVSVLINETPVARSFGVTVNEDETISFQLLGTAGVPLTYTIITPPANGWLIQPTFGGPDVDFQGFPDFFGQTYFEYVVDDGSITSAPARVNITVLPVNDAPTFSLSSWVSAPEDWLGSGINYFAYDISVGPSNERGQAYRFIVNNDNPALFVAQPYILVGGKLTFRPAKNAVGLANVEVIMEDTGGVARGGVNRSTNYFTIELYPVNDPPSFNLSTNQVVVLENAGDVVIPNFATDLLVGPPDEVLAGQILSDFEVTRNTNPSLFATQPQIDSTGTLAFTPEPFVNGFAYISVRVSDDGGTANGGKDTSVIKTFMIRVLPVNQPPVFYLDWTEASLQTVYEDAPMQVVSNFIVASSIFLGTNETTQGYSIIVQNDNPGLFYTQPYIRKADNTLLYRPRPNSNGVANVNVILRDTGGRANGGEDSATNSFVITVLPVNDPPSAQLVNRVVTVLEDSGATISNLWRNIKTGPFEYHENTQTVSFVTTAITPDLFSVQPTNSPAGVLTFATAPDANGITRVLVDLYDSGPVSNPYDNGVASYNFDIRILPVNDAPTLTITQSVVQVPVAAGMVRTNVLYGHPGAFNETNQALTFQIVNNTNRAIFLRQPIIYPNGMLEFAPTNSASAIGKEVTLGVRVVDNGGTSYGGINASPYVTNLTIRLTAP
ncbi:FG-GAP-like repeat-containing protein [Fontisphaera persica]|uniref:FG-GAP-like repeat-containing protein n=1 Tax=Fontisphaera persica TaxID=2974023 RepID=UPI0024BF4BFC|nr:FG-GAP-like repeat-containing protein [Fontisphaera persica]WCJ60264.1 FG-GAP-like repeat-containing protein [Fontisphaera persica]